MSALPSGESGWWCPRIHVMPSSFGGSHGGLCCANSVHATPIDSPPRVVCLHEDTHVTRSPGLSSPCISSVPQCVGDQECTALRRIRLVPATNPKDALFTRMKPPWHVLVDDSPRHKRSLTPPRRGPSTHPRHMVSRLERRVHISRWRVHRCVKLHATNRAFTSGEPSSWCPQIHVIPSLDRSRAASPWQQRAYTSCRGILWNGYVAATRRRLHPPIPARTI